MRGGQLRSGRFSWMFPILIAAVLFIGVLGGPIILDSLMTTGPPDTPSAAEAAERVDELQSIQLLSNTTREIDENSSWTVRNQTIRTETDEFRSEIIATSGPRPGAGSLVVSNGSVRLFYDPRSNRVSRTTVEESDQSDLTTQVESLFSAVEDGDGLESSVPIFPALSTAEGDDQSAEWRDTPVTVEYQGTETVAGRETYVLRIEPTVDDAQLVYNTLWFDQEFLYPIQYDRVIDQPGGRYRFTSTPQTVEFNPSLDDDVFELDAERIPNNASLVETEQFDSRTEMVSTLDRPVPDLAVPDRFEFASGVRADGPNRDLSYRYADGIGQDATVISVYVTDRSIEVSPNQTVTIDGRAVDVFIENGNTQFRWQRGDWRISVSSTMDRDALREIVEATLTTGDS